MTTQSRRQLIVFGLLAILSTNLIITAAESDEDIATADAQKWLALVDEQKYEESWLRASSMFRNEVKQEQWIAALKRSREPLGAVTSRTRTRLQFSKTLRGAPDGDYAILHFQTSFDSKSATERLTLVREDGRWHMAAYGIY
jgi:hypothetical protein